MFHERFLGGRFETLHNPQRYPTPPHYCPEYVQVIIFDFLIADFTYLFYCQEFINRMRISL